MNTNWNLDNIYPSVDSTEFKTDIENYRKAVDNLNKWCSENFTNTNNPQEKLEKYIELKNIKFNGGEIKPTSVEFMSIQFNKLNKS